MATSKSSTDYTPDGIFLIQKELQQLEDNCKEEIRQYHEQLRILEDEHRKRIRQLREKQAALSQMLNNHQELTKDLPTEVMSLIFRRACSIRTGPAIAFPIAHVSVRWRQIAWSTPHLWTRMLANVSPKTLPSILSLLQLHLNNAKYLLLSLHLRFPERWTGSLSALLKLLSDRENAQKIRSLSGNNFPQQLTRLFSRVHFSHLEALSVHGPSSGPPVVFPLMDLPCLRNISLYNVNLPTAESSFPMITSLDLGFMPINTCIKLLFRCPNIATISTGVLLNDEPMADLGFPPSPEIVTFNRLTRIRWRFDFRSISMGLFRRIHAPCLQRLYCGYRVNGPIPPETVLLSFADSFPSTLILLELSSLESWPPHFFQRVFAQTMHLESLILDEFDRFAAEDAIWTLYPGPEPEVSYLPSLRGLTIRLRKYSTTKFDGEFGWTIFGLLERQWRSGVGRFTLKLEMCSIKWARKAQLGILSLVKAGFELEIVECGVKPSWLEIGCH